jgi:hypothetical protein
MKHIVCSALLFVAIANIYSQSWQKAVLHHDGSIITVPVDMDVQYESGKSLNQIQGFPLAFVANPSFKNMRNVTLHDLTSDGIPEIIFAVNDTLFVYAKDSLLWKRKLIGTAVYPPSVADITGNGDPDIVLTTGGVPAAGRVYAFDKNGNIHTGWPVNFNNNWMICAAALSDLNNDGKCEVIVCERITPNGRVHILKNDGTSLNTNWPVTLNGIPAVTPSVGDVDGDGQKDIVVNSTNARYVFDLNGNVKPGFPIVTEPGQKYSYQSPVLADFNNDNTLEITGSSHGDSPQYYVTQHNGTAFPGWPVSVPDDLWTYSPPTVVKRNNNWNIFMSRPIGETPDEMLFGWDSAGVMLPGFPIVKAGGLEGVICVANINNDQNYEIVFGSNLLDATGYGFIHAYSIGFSTELSGFPLRPRGWTFMNGVCINDVNGDGMMNLVVLSYTNTFGAGTDSIYINVYDLQQPYSTEAVLWGTYKGSNNRTGLFEDISTSVNVFTGPENKLLLYPNPAIDIVEVQAANDSRLNSIKVFDETGRQLMLVSVSQTQKCSLDVSSLKNGIYYITAQCNEGHLYSGMFLKQ